MTPGPDILVVAPDGQLVRSIAFALEAEGLKVQWRPDLPRMAERLAGPRCSIVDEAPIMSAAAAWERLAGLPHPLILLVDRLPRIPDGHTGPVLRKPLLGRDLVDAVHAALAMRGGLREIP